MPRVVVNKAVPPTSADLSIRVNERPATFLLSAYGVPNDLLYLMTPRTFDLLLIAEAVFAADSLIARGGSSRSNLGAAWSRNLEFVLPVKDALFWRSVEEDLVELLGFLTGDRFRFQFVPRSGKVLKSPGLGLGHQVRADSVVLFSGGLDSLTGSLEALSPPDARVLLVTHCSAQKTLRIQADLVRALQRRFFTRVEWVPARGRLIGVEARETTQRSRSFLYVALGFAAASLVGLSGISLYENGIVSLNLPISRQVIGTMATRTTHPRFLNQAATLLSRVAEAPFTVTNPFAWLTKAEVLERLRSLGSIDLIGKTTICSGVRARTREEPLCGCCSQCLDRRFAVLAADVAAFDPAHRYEVDLFMGVRDTPRERTMANDWTRSGLGMSRISLAEFAVRFGAELADVAAGYPDRAYPYVVSEAFHMHRRHGQAVRRVAETALAGMAGGILDGTVPSDSLLGSLLRSGATPRLDMPVAESEVETALDGSASIFPLRLVFDPAAGPLLLIRGLGEFRGAHLGLVGALRPYLESDVAASMPPESHTFVDAGKLGGKGAVRQRAKRCRDDFAKEYEIVEGSKPEYPILIHSKHSSGYQLDPTARFIEE